MADLKLSPNQKQIIDLLAHLIVMAEIDANVQGFEGIFNKYLGELPDKQKDIWLYFKKHCCAVKRAIAEGIKPDA